MFKHKPCLSYKVRNVVATMRKAKIEPKSDFHALKEDKIIK